MREKKYAVYTMGPVANLNLFFFYDSQHDLKQELRAEVVFNKIVIGKNPLFLFNQLRENSSGLAFEVLLGLSNKW